MSQAQPVVRVTRANLNVQVADHIREEVFAGRLHPGTRLDQDGLASRLGVSKIPVREAIIALEGEGLLVSYPHRGAFVAPLTPDDIREHFSAFGAVSAVAAARAAATFGTDDVAALAAVLDRMRAPNAPLDDLNDEFHRRINRSGSRRLRGLIARLASSMPSAFLSHSDHHDAKEALQEHAAIVSAIGGGDADRAAVMTRRHFDRSGDAAARIMEEAGFWRTT